jgi:signal recognition particle subunit SRP54
MLEDLVRKFDGVLRKLRGTGKLTEKNIEEALREIRRVLLEADVHYKVAKEFIASVRAKAVGREVLDSVTPGQMLVKIVHDELIVLLGNSSVPLNIEGALPAVVMIVGLQGSGKTTFAAKLGIHLGRRGRKALLAAADIYRPAAIEQLIQLGRSAGLPVFSLGQADPVLIASGAVAEARKHSLDTVILDTAGRLHVDDAMMAELEAIRKAVKPSEILFVADGMTGQDAVRSAQAFAQRLDFGGIVLTKMDGDARGGAALSIRSVTGKPIKFLSFSEKLDGMETFHPDRLASRILGMGDIVSLVEKAQESVDRDKAEALARKIGTREFTLEDFLDQLHQVKKMGPISELMDMIPGMRGKMPPGAAVDEKSLVRVEAIIRSMTVEERRKPNILNGSRRKRIAAGSGTLVQDVNRLLKDFQTMQTMMKRMGRLRGMKTMRGMPFGFNPS